MTTKSIIKPEKPTLNKVWYVSSTEDNKKFHNSTSSEQTSQSMPLVRPTGKDIDDEGLAPIHVPRYNFQELANLLPGNPWHWAAVVSKASTLTKLGFEFIKSEGKPNVTNKESRDIDKFLTRIYEENQADLSDIFEEFAIDLYHLGNAELEIARTGNGNIDCLYSIPSVTMYLHKRLPVMLQYSTCPYQIDGSRIIWKGDAASPMTPAAVFPMFMSKVERKDFQHLLPENQKRDVVINDVAYMKNSIPSLDPYYGITDAAGSITGILGDNYAADYNLQFFKNNAVPRYAVTITGGRVTQQVVDEITKFLNTEIKGQFHRTIVLPLPRGMEAKFQPLDSEVNDASFIAYKKMNREEILGAHRVPPSEVGLWEDANRATAIQQAKTYWQKVIRPDQARIERLMNRILRNGLGITQWTFKFKDIEYTDDQEKATTMSLYSKAMSNAYSSINETIKTVSDGVTNGTIDEEEGKSRISKLMSNLDDVDKLLDMEE